MIIIIKTKTRNKNRKQKTAKNKRSPVNHNFNLYSNLTRLEDQLKHSIMGHKTNNSHNSGFLCM